MVSVRSVHGKAVSEISSYKVGCASEVPQEHRATVISHLTPSSTKLYSAFVVTQLGREKLKFVVLPDALFRTAPNFSDILNLGFNISENEAA